MATPLRVLILEDRQSDAELMIHELRRAGFEPAWEMVENEADYLAHLDPAPDVILADYTLPQFDAERALQLLQERQLDTPFIVVTGSISEEVAVACMKQGAADYLLKDRLARLGPAVKHALRQQDLRQEKRQAEAALRRSEQRYRRLVESSPDGIAVHSQGKFVFINSAGTRLLGAASPDDLLGRPVIDFVHPDYQALARERIGRVLRDGSPAPTMEEKLIRLDGTVIEAEVTATPFTYQGQPAVQVVVRDITPRKRAEQQVRLQAAALEAASNAIAITDPQGVILWVNPAFTELTGYSRFEAVGRTTRLLKSGKQDEAFYRHLWETVLAGQVWRGELINRRKDGSLYAEEMTITPVRDEKGEISHFIAIKQDITDRNQREREREALLTVAAALRSAPTRAEILAILLDQVMELFEAEGAALVMRDPATGETMVELGRGASTQFTGFRLTPGEGLSARVMDTGRPFIIDDIRREPRLARPELVEQVRAAACVPLSTQEQTIGALWVGRRTPVTGQDLRLLIAVADIAANAIHRATLHEQAERHLQRLAALRRIDAAIIGSRDLPVTLDILLEQVIAQLGVDAADVLLLDPEHETLVHAADRGFRTGIAQGTHVPLAGSYAGRAALEGEIVHISNLAAAEGFRRPYLPREEGFVAYYAVPFIAKERIEGVLEVFHRAPLTPDTEWLDFLEALAAQTAIAIENARLFAESRRLLQQTQDQARQVQQIMDTVPEGVFLLDADRRILLANPTAQKYLSLLADARVGDTLDHLARRPIESLLQSHPGGLWYELEVAGPPHAIFEVDARALEDGSAAGGWVLVIRNVTQEREVQQRIQQQERLASVGQLAAGIAHDFNNILTSMIGFAELVRRVPELSTSVKQDLDRVIQQGRRAAHLIRQILDFSRQSISEKHPLDLLPLIKETIKLLERTIPEDIHITLAVEPGYESFMLNADPTQIQQVLTNLAVNARDAMPRGGSLIFRLSHLKLQAGQRPPTPELSPGDWIALAVADTGVGIPPDALPHIFEPFFTTKEVGKGTGLGLAQVFGIVKQHGGDIDVESQPGEGTTMTLYLPASLPREDEAAPTGEREAPRGHGEVILLVEDEPAVLDVVKTTLEYLGYQVLTASNGLRALEVFDEHRAEIALVLTDVTMPELGGIALAQELRERDPATKVVAMTGYPLEVEAKDLLGQGIVEWLRKPLSVEQLARAMKQVLYRQAS